MFTRIEDNFEVFDLIILENKVRDAGGREILEGIRKSENIKYREESIKNLDGSELPSHIPPNNYNLGMIPVLNLSEEPVYKQKEIYEGMNVSQFIQKPVSKLKLLEVVLFILTQK